MPTRQSRIIRFIGLETLVVCLCGEIGLLRGEDRMRCARYLLARPSYLVENTIASHAGGRPGPALIRRESS